MRHNPIIAVMSVCFGLFLVCLSPSWAGDSLPNGGVAPLMFAKSRLIVDTQDGRTITFDVELANSRAEQSRGLMYRKTLAKTEGMLFDFHKMRHISMWMKNTYIPLDMVFADHNKRIVHIVENTVPMSEKLINPPVEAQYVLEVISGTVEAFGIQKGDEFRLENLKSQ